MPAREPIDILVIGDCLTDVLVRPHGPRQRASDTPARIVERPGGQGANQAAWLAAERMVVGLVARVARDERERHEELLRASGVVPFLAADSRLPTGRIVVLIDPDTGGRDMFSDRGAAAALAPGDLDAGLESSRRWIHVSGYAVFGEHGPDVAAAAIAGAHQKGLGVSVDPASTSELERFGIERFLRIVAGVDMLMPNDDEARLLTATGSPAAAAVALLEVARTVVVTCGAAGAMVAERDGDLVESTAREVRVLDTTGAGDAFAAGYLAARLAGGDAATCLARGMRAAERAVTRLGAHPE